MMTVEKGSRLGEYIVGDPLAESAGDDLYGRFEVEVPYRRLYRAERRGKGGHVVDIILVVYSFAGEPDEQEAVRNRWGHELAIYGKLQGSTFFHKLERGAEETLDNGETVGWIAFEWVESVPLSEAVKAADWTSDSAWRVWTDAVDALALLRERTDGHIHVSLSPATVRVCNSAGTRRGMLTALNFATADMNTNSPVDKSTVNRAARAPETLMRCMNIESMQYSLALLLVYMLTGRHPWDGKPIKGALPLYRHMRGEAPKLEGLDASLREVAGKALHRDSSKRYHDMARFIEAVRPHCSIEWSPEWHPFGESQSSAHKTAVSADSAVRNDDDQGDSSAADSSREPRIKVKIEQRHGDGFKAVAGMEGLKGDLKRDFVDVFAHQELASQYGITIPACVLFGPPGCGKTYITNRLAEEMGVEYTAITPSDLGNIFVHGSQMLIRQLFDKAVKRAGKNGKGVLLFIDELDAVAPRRTADDHSNSAGEVAELLTQLNDLAKKKVYVVAATNCMERVDPAVLRSGRFDKAIYVPLPDEEARIQLFRHELRTRPHAKKIDYTRLAELTDGFTSSDISYVVGECARLSFAETLRRKSDKPAPIRQTMIEDVIGRTRSSVTRQEMARYEQMRDEYAKTDRRARRRVGFVSE